VVMGRADGVGEVEFFGQFLVDVARNGSQQVKTSKVTSVKLLPSTMTRAVFWCWGQRICDALAWHRCLIWSMARSGFFSNTDPRNVLLFRHAAL
jgi:hypothetical protein